jgi:hypothetical protein
MVKQYWSSPVEKLRQYRRHARDAYARARRSIVPAERESYTVMAERWLERAEWLESEMRAMKNPDTAVRPGSDGPRPRSISSD